MSTKLYSPTASLRRKLQGALATLALGAALAPAAMAQVVVPADNSGTFVSRFPFGTYFGYERSAMIYTAAEIGSSGTITQVGFYTTAVSTPGLAATKIYLKTVTNNSFAAATTVAAEETGATLVYDGTLPASSFTANSWVNVPLTTSFAYNGTSNLEVIVETNATGQGNEGVSGKRFRMTDLGVTRFQTWATDGTAPTTTGTLATPRPNIQLTGLTASNCAAPTALAVSSITANSASVAFTPATGATSYTVTYTPQGGTPVTVSPAPTASPINLTGLASGTTYSVTIASNCSGSTTSQQSTVGFATPAVVPANDNPSGAITLPIAASCTPVNGTNTAATTTTPAGYANPGTCGAAINPKDVWYKVTTSATGAGSTALRLTVTGAPAGLVRLFSATSATGPFTQVACSAGATNNTVAPTLTASGLTPNTTYYISVAGYGSSDTQGAFTICATTVPDNDAEVQVIYALGKAPAGSAQIVQAVIRNAGGQSISNLPVTLTVSGAVTFTNSQLIGTLAPGASSTVTFGSFTVPATATGTNTLTVSLLADDNTANNSQAYTQNVTTNTFSYVSAATVIGANNSVGFPAASTAAFVARYSTAVNRTITSVVANIGDPASVGNTVYGVVVSSTGAVLGRSANYVVVAADVNQRRTFTLNTPVAVTAGDFYVGLVQTPSVNSTDYFPMSYVPQTPTRTGTFYVISPFSATAGGTLTDAAPQGFGIFVVEANADVTTGTSAALNRAISLYPNPSTNGEVTLSVQGAKAQAGLEVQIINTLGQTVYTNAQLRDNFENKLNLSHLSAGVYTLKVKMGNEYTIRQLSLTK